MAIDVKDFGAKGDGLVDDTKAIRAAMNYASEEGEGVVTFPPGVYRLDYGLDNLSIKTVGNEQPATYWGRKAEAWIGILLYVLSVGVMGIVVLFTVTTVWDWLMV